MKKIMMILATAVFCLSAGGAEPIKVKLWPDGAPTKNGHEGKPERWEGAKVYEVSDPELWIYPAKKPNGQCIVDAPGGGYKYLSTDNEGTMMIDWMNTRGITFVILKYRVPNGHWEVPAEDAREAIKYMRKNASKYGINPNEIGIMGSSAGGHFAATAATMYNTTESRPDFQILLYPVISMKEITHPGTREHLLGKNPSKELVEKYTIYNHVDKNTPPAFIVLAADDLAVPPMNSILYVEALQKNGIPYSFHMYPSGGHGFGFRDTFPYKHEFTTELDSWLRSIKK